MRFVISVRRAGSSKRRGQVAWVDLVRRIYLFCEEKDFVPALLAELVEELRARYVRIVLKAGADLLLPELLH